MNTLKKLGIVFLTFGVIFVAGLYDFEGSDGRINDFAIPIEVEDIQRDTDIVGVGNSYNHDLDFVDVNNSYGHDLDSVGVENIIEETEAVAVTSSITSKDNIAKEENVTEDSYLSELKKEYSSKVLDLQQDISLIEEEVAYIYEEIISFENVVQDGAVAVSKPLVIPTANYISNPMVSDYSLDSKGELIMIKIPSIIVEEQLQKNLLVEQKKFYEDTLAILEF